LRIDWGSLQYVDPSWGVCVDFTMEADESEMRENNISKKKENQITVLLIHL